MNLAGLVAPYVSATINQNLAGNLLISTGTVINADSSTTPTYNTISGVEFQVQSLTSDDLKLLASLNIQGTARAMYYMTGQVQGVNRPSAQGGDIIQVPTGLTDAGLDTWLCRQVLEGWDAGGWCKVACTLQVNPS